MMGKYLVFCGLIGYTCALIYEMGPWHEIHDAGKVYSLLEEFQNVAHKIQLPSNYIIDKGEENAGHGHYVWYRFSLEINGTKCRTVIFNVVSHNQVYTAVEEDTCNIGVAPATTAATP